MLIVKLGNVFFRWRDTLFSLVILSGIVIIIYNQNTLLTGWFGDFETDFYFTINGFIFIIVGIFIRAITIGFIYIKRAGIQKKIHADELFQEGLFAHTRNPLYLGNTFILIGSVLTINLYLFWFVILPLFFFIYYSIIKAEEDFLYKRFSEKYIQYKNRVPRFFPSNFDKFPASFQNLYFSLKRVIKTEHPTQSIILLIFFLITIIKFYYRYQIDFSYIMMKIILILLIFVILYYTVSHILKQKKKLEFQ